MGLLVNSDHWKEKLGKQ